MKIPNILIRFYGELNFCRNFFEKSSKLNFMKFFQWQQSCFMRMDGQTENTKLIVTFRNFANALKDFFTRILKSENSCISQLRTFYLPTSCIQNFKLYSE
jgi:hypothetical protein